jgi:hypothetical protein
MEIEAWLKDAENNESQILDIIHNDVIGFGIKRGLDTIIDGLRTSRVVIVKDSQVDLGFFILTSYPKI